MQKRILKHFGFGKDSDSKRPTVSLPILPNTRPRPLTPPFSDENASKVSKTHATTPNSFFQVLPPEIRRQILIEAFGNQRLHIRLDRDKPGPQKRRNKQQICEKWLWGSPRCHRNALTLPFLIFPHAWDDYCLDGRSCEEINHSKRPCEHVLGAMGWLLTSRQAYVEGIEVLYATNTINISQKQVILNIRELILPHRLASIRFLEVTWDLDVRYFDNDSQSWKQDVSRFQPRPLFEAIKTAFPGLQKLIVSLHTEHKCYDIDAAFYTPTLEPMDELVRALSELQETYLAFPYSVFPWDLATEPHSIMRERFPKIWFLGPSWRSVGHNVSTRDASEASGALITDAETGTHGYFIVRGQDDTPQRWVFECGNRL